MSFPKILNTDLPDLKLIKPDVNRDAKISLSWLDGDTGIDTLLLMGVPKEQITKPNIQAEEDRIKDFLERQDQLNWAISYQDRVVGATWVDLVENNHLLPPSVHIMIGDKNLRGKGIGNFTIKSVIDYLRNDRSYKTIYSRHLIHNVPMAKVFNKLGFVNDGNSYQDEDDLSWQNVILRQKVNNIN